MKLSFEHISKLYGDTAALQQIDLTLGSGVYGLNEPNLPVQMLQQRSSMGCSVQTEPGRRR